VVAAASRAGVSLALRKRKTKACRDSFAVKNRVASSTGGAEIESIAVERSVSAFAFSGGTACHDE